MKNQPGMIRYARLATTLGNMLAAATGRGLCALRFCEKGESAQTLAELQVRFPGAEWVEDPKALQPLLEKIQKILAGQLSPKQIDLDLVGTDFQRGVWRKMLEIPWGQTYSYSDLARQVGRPRAVRAVASACASNPIAFIVPCHRILRKGGGLGGFYWGLDKKQELLAREGV